MVSDYCANDIGMMMLRRLVYASLLCLMMSLCFGQTRFVTTHSPHRIVSLAPNLTEILFDLGAGDQIVGVSQYSDYPVQAKRLPIVATYNDVDIEKIIALHPDLVVAWRQGNSMVQIAKLKQMGFHVYLASFDHLTDIPKEIDALGRLTGHLHRAKKLTEKFLRQYKYLQKHYESTKKVTVFYQLWNQPLMTLNNQTIVGQIIVLCGGKNIFGHTFQVAPQISVASVLQADPEVILVQQNLGWQDRWVQYPELSAVKEHHLYEINPDLIERYGPRVLDGAAQICHIMNEVRDHD